MEYHAVITNIFYGAISLLGVTFVYLVKEAKDELKEMKTSVIELNTKIAVVIEKQDGHEKRIEKLESYKI